MDNLRIVYTLRDGTKALVTRREDGTGLYLINISDMKNTEQKGGGGGVMMKGGGGGVMVKNPAGTT